MRARPLDPVSALYVDGLAVGVLRYQRCATCDQVQRLARYACERCGSDRLEWLDAEGIGTVYAVSEVSRAPSMPFRTLVPYTLVLVDLDEGARVMGHAEPGVVIGDRVVAGYFEHDGRPLLRFRHR
jgi:uncharacterized OB-fold protein